MLPTHRVSTHPGKVLLEEFLEPLEISQSAFAKHIGVTAQRINQLINAKRALTADTAWRLAAALGTTPEFWLNLQMSHELSIARPKTTLQIRQLVQSRGESESPKRASKRQLSVAPKQGSRSRRSSAERTVAAAR